MNALYTQVWFGHLTALDGGTLPETTWHDSKVNQEEPDSHCQRVRINGDISFFAHFM